MITVYRVIIDRFHYQELATEDLEWWQNACLGRSMMSTWKAPECFVRYPNLDKPDIWGIERDDILVCNTRAMRALQTFADQSAEQFTVMLDGEELSLLNVTMVINCLDKKLSEYPADLPHMITKYAFHKRRLDYSLFKIPETQLRELYTVEGCANPNDEFKPVVESHGLKGLLFQGVWREEQ